MLKSVVWRFYAPLEDAHSVVEAVDGHGLSDGGNDSSYKAGVQLAHTEELSTPEEMSGKARRARRMGEAWL